MIRNQWYAVLDSKELKKGQVLGVTRLSEKLVFWRDKQGAIGCAYDRCVHRGAALSKGKVLSNNKLQCPFHGFEYDTTGRVTKIPAIGQDTPVPERFAITAYPAKEAHGFIWIWWGDHREDYPKIPFFDDIDEDLVYNTFQDHWPVHYSRAIENQLDLVHLPFVHENTIGRGCKTVVDGPIVELSDNELTFWVHNRKDDGKPPRKADELSKKDSKIYLKFHFPNIWQNHLGDKFLIFAAFAPVDEENTVLYLRLYQKIIRVPILRKIIGKIGNFFNKKVLLQDKNVVISQRPKKTQLHMNEELIRGDLPIIKYRQKRAELLEENNN
ncbi:MAG: aromatic ring-hydroxylating dioxygenase subunit alpha [Asgard group archaeon]|nr:aromatic ring-hydroxylating dioxygenase subunit alpha [Asgard group archaeon]